jgi:hypothetical protein
MLQANGMTPFTSLYSGDITGKHIFADQINWDLQDSSKQNFPSARLSTR